MLRGPPPVGAPRLCRACGKRAIVDQGANVEAATVIKPEHEATRKHLLFTDEHEDLRE
jgi:hypothetical protein